jgi:hypothetical protein
MYLFLVSGHKSGYQEETSYLDHIVKKMDVLCRLATATLGFLYSITPGTIHPSSVLCTEYRLLLSSDSFNYSIRTNAGSPVQN